MITLAVSLEKKEEKTLVVGGICGVVSDEKYFLVALDEYARRQSLN